MSKQDRQGARTLAELMGRYNFGKTFAEIMGIAESARKSAEDASKAASSLDKKLTSEEIFNRLTNNGQLQGLFREEDGELYINASYLATGVISSADGTVKLDLNNNCVTVDGKRNGYKIQTVLSASGMKIFGENSEGEMEEVIDFRGGIGGLPSGIVNPSWKENTGLLIATALGVLTLGTSEAGTEIAGSYVDIDSPVGSVRILGKEVYWKSNDDGTFSLAGR